VSEPPWRVELAPAAQRQLRKLPPDATVHLRGPILALARDPRPHGVAALTGSTFWRLRVGDLRIVYAIDVAAHAVIILRVARRSESTYRRVR
jgi:mRNA interferase RelE/StbE